MESNRISTGSKGLDEILKGGLPPNHIYLLQGEPGTGKTTLGFQFLLEGVRLGEPVLYLTLLQTEEELRETALSHGWDLAGVEISTLIAAAEAEARFAEQTLLHSSEVQLSQVMQAIEEAVARVKPARLVFDSIEQFRLLAGDEVVYRQKVLAMQRLLAREKVTALFLEVSEHSPEFKTLAHGVILLDMVVPPYGEMRRRLMVEKMRGVVFAGGYHSCRIRTGGLAIYPRLPLKRQTSKPSWGVVPCTIDPLDEMLGGGLEEGSACLLAGETGTGKSSIATAYAYAAAQRGQAGAIFLFDERLDTFLRRSAGLGMDLAPLRKQGLLAIRQVDIGELSAGELAHDLREEVEQRGVKVVVIDSLTGYFAALPEEPQLLAQLHEMLTYLGQQAVLTLLVTTEHGLVTKTSRGIDASYIADTVLLLRRFEAFGAVRIAVSVIKKRGGEHEKLIRELQITGRGLQVGEPLKDFQGVLTGEPVFVGERAKLMEGGNGT